MTQEEKSLLLQDLCARLPYKTIIKGIVYEDVFDDNGEETDEVIEKEVTFNLYIISENSIGFQGEWISLELCKPYLRPMPSMTEEEVEEYKNIDNRSYSCPMDYAHIPASERIDWLNKNHFDYRGLIPKGLAIEVTEENNPYEN